MLEPKSRSASEEMEGKEAKIEIRPAVEMEFDERAESAAVEDGKELQREWNIHRHEENYPLGTDPLTR